MKKIYYFLMHILICVLLTVSVNAQAVYLNYTSIDSVRTCDTSFFTAQFTLPAGSTHLLKITDSIHSSCGSTSSCPGSQLTVFHVISPSTIGDFSWNNGTHSWDISLNPGSYSISYSVRLDCGSIPSCGSSGNLVSVNMFQSWGDTVSGVTFNIDSTNTAYLLSSVSYPLFVEQTNGSFSGNYLDTVPIYHIYLNAGQADGAIQFYFNASLYNACASDSLLSVYYAVGNPNNPSLLSYNDSLASGFNNTVVVPAGQALVIRKDVVVKGCLDEACTNERDTLKWKCNFTDTTFSFCNTCQQNVFDQVYSLTPSTGAAISITRITPDSVAVTNDYTCMGRKEQWVYKIKNTGQVNFHYALIELYCLGNDPHQLLLIDTSDVQIQPALSSNSSWYDIKTLMSQSVLCHDTITAPLQGMNIYIQNFMKGDSVILSFSTFRCCEEADTLLKAPGYLAYGNWVLNASGTDSCGTPVLPTGNYINSNPQWNMNLDYFPTVSDLVVPHDSLFGPSTLLLFADENSDAAVFQSNYQILGCSGTAAACGMHGYMRVHVNCQEGLTVDTPLVHFANFPIDSARTWNPVYHYQTIADTVCEPGDYYYYFDLSDINAFALIKRGRLVFRLRSCCGSNPSSPTDYTVDVALLPDPGLCDTLSFPPGDSLPPVCSSGNCCFMGLGKISDNINILCPGCFGPGAVVNSYLIQRTSLGVRDSDNDGRADPSLAAIDSAYLSTYSTLVRTSFANHGDQVKDFMVGKFQEGDSASGGYTYQQMLDHSAILNFMQLDRTFTTSGAQMNLIPYYFKLYVDIPADSASANCVDCTGPDTGYKTIHIIKAQDTLVNSYVQYDPASYRLFFTFDATNDSTVHNMYKNVVLHDTLFKGYRENQRYRMETRYSVCGYFAPQSAYIQSQNDKQQQAQINNFLFFSGKQQPVNAFNTIPTMPNTLSDLHAHGWTLDSADTARNLVNQVFADSSLFECAASGGRFYFYSDEVENDARYISESGNGCHKQISIHPYVRTGAILSATSPSLYPYEYRLPSLKPYHCKARIPTGYTIDTVATIYSEFLVNGTNNGYAVKTIPRPFIVHPVTTQDSIDIDLESLFNTYPIYCVTDTVSAIPFTSQNLYSGDNNLTLTILIDLHAQNCNPDSIFTPDSTDMRVQFKDNTVSCGDSLVMKCDTLFFDPVRIYYKDTVKIPNPDLVFYFTPGSAIAKTHTVCWNFTIKNLGSDNAYNVFIAPQYISYFSNWTIDSSGTVLLIPNGNRIFHFSTVMTPGTIITTDSICAQYDTCAVADTFNIYYGWNCDGFPDTLSSGLCFLNSDTVNFTDGSIATNVTESHPSSFNLCEPFVVKGQFFNSGSGSLYADTLYLTDIDSNLTIISVQLTSCFNPDTITLPVNNPPLWYIANALDSAGMFLDSAFNLGNCLTVLVTVQAECKAARHAGDTLDVPHILILAHSFCDSILPPWEAKITPLLSTQWTTYYSGVSHCTDCFTLTKTALQDTVAVGDTASFEIIICGNNADTETVNLTEYLPTDFDTLPGSVIPDSVIVPPQGCDTIIVSGFFHTPGSCPDAAYTNTVEISTANIDTTASACVTVIQPVNLCIALADTVIADSSFTASFGFNSFNNDTVFIAGRLYVNNSFAFNNCLVYMGAGAQITVIPPDSLTLNNTTILACDTMWQGIEAMPNTMISINTQSRLYDANVGFYIHNKAILYVFKSSIYDCVKGIMTEVNPGGYNNIILQVEGSNFGLISPAFKPYYNGQPQHGTLPETGIELNDMWLTTIGNVMGAGNNYFYNLNRGISGYRSNFTIANCEFKKIATDTFYGQTYDGTAMISRGQQGGRPGWLTVIPLTSGNPTVHDGNRGIYTRLSSLDVKRTDFINLQRGIFSAHCQDKMHTFVSDCHIEAVYYGIWWRFSIGAQYMTAQYNTITMNGFKTGKAINIEEASISGFSNYTIYNNYVYITEEKYGIKASAVLKPSISSNFIYQYSTGANNFTQGIALESCDTALVGCNYITSYYPSGINKSYGIYNNLSTNSKITCNYSKYHNTGMFFGGYCDFNNDFKGNIMDSTDLGLMLNSAAVLGIQKHKGNVWLYVPPGQIGAINLSNPFISRFIIHTDTGTIYHPDVVPSFWFVPDTTGQPYACGTLCYTLSPEGNDKNLLKEVAHDSTLTEDFEEESKSMAKQNLLLKLAYNATLRNSDTTFVNFYNFNLPGTLGKLKDVKERFSYSLNYDSLFLNLISTADSLIQTKNDSLNLIDSLAQANQNIDYSQQRTTLMDEINILNGTILNLKLQRQAIVDGKIDSALYVNNTIYSSEIPEQNNKYINECYGLMQKFGMDTLFSRFTPILAIANQCPYSGGPAVIIARNFIEEWNDTLEYNDDIVCLQQGIYRQSSTLAKTEINADKFTVVPNPANNKIVIKIFAEKETDCELKIKDVLGNIVLQKNLICENESHEISLQLLNQGVYFVTINTNGKSLGTKKLIIVR